MSSGQPLHLIASLSEDGVAKGDLYWDDGETLDSYETDQYAYVYFTVEKVQKTAPFTFTAAHQNAFIRSSYYRHITKGYLFTCFTCCFSDFM